MSTDDAEDAARILERHPDYRVLRRLTQRPLLEEMPEGAKKAIMLDVEATGTDTSKDEVIELGMVAFAYTPEGEILGIVDIFSRFSQPSAPISAEITALTGIDNAMVDGHEIDDADVDAFVGDADLIIAHHADYDRRMVERRWPVFVTKCWACTMSEIDWKSEGFEGMKLGLLLMQAGFFHNGHRATSDCQAGIELLANPMPVSKRTGMSLLIERARRTRVRISAVSTPFEMKDVLKQRDYRWTGEDRLPHKSWQKDVLPEEAEAEVAFLEATVYRGRREPVLGKVSAYERFSDRVSWMQKGPFC